MSEDEKPNPYADAFREAVRQMELPFASPFYFTDNQGEERQCTGLLPHVGSPRGTMIGTRFDPGHKTFWAATRGLDYNVVTLDNAKYEQFDAEIFVNLFKAWGWYGPEKMMPSFFVDDDWNAEDPNPEPQQQLPSIAGLLNLPGFPGPGNKGGQ